MTWLGFAMRHWRSCAVLLCCALAYFWHLSKLADSYNAGYQSANAAMQEVLTAQRAREDAAASDALRKLRKLDATIAGLRRKINEAVPSGCESMPAVRVLLQAASDAANQSSVPAGVPAAATNQE